MKKNYSLFATFILTGIFVVATAQPGKARVSMTNTLEKAEVLYTQGAYMQAAAAFETVVQHNATDAVTRWKLAELYLKINDYKRAAQQFKVFYDDTDPDVQLHYPNAGFYYAVALRQLGNHETARGILTRYIDKNKTNSDAGSALLLARAKVEREGCDFALSNYSNMVAEVQNIGIVTNGVYNEAAASYADDVTMYYTAVATNAPVSMNESRRTFAKLYRAKNNGTVWIDQTALPEAVNQAGVHNANACVSPDGKRMYFTRCAENDGKMQCDLYLSQLTSEGGFATPIKLEEDVNAPNASTTMPFVMDAGRGDDLLYFASTRKGSKGGYDIWSVVRHPEGTYDNLQNLADINTVVDELSPFVDKEGMIYFSSNGHAGYGGYDVFSYQVVEQEPIIKNLGTPVNSPADDLYFTTNATGLSGFLVSNRVGSRAFDENNPTSSDDIFTLKITRKKAIKDKTTPKAPVSNVTMANEIRKDIIVVDKVEEVVSVPTKTVETAKNPIVETKMPQETAKNPIAETPVKETAKEAVKEATTEPAKEATPIKVSGANYKNAKRNVSADACARACLYDVTSGVAYSVRDVPCANDNNIDFALAPNKKYIFVLERAGETLQSREVSTIGSKKSEIFHPRLDSREVTVAPPTLNASVAESAPSVNNTNPTTNMGTNPTTNPPITKTTTIAVKAPVAPETFIFKGGLAADVNAVKAIDAKGATVTLYRLESESSAPEIARKQLSADNAYEFTLTQGLPYRLVAEKEGFLKVSVDFTADKNNIAKTTQQLILREKKANVAFKINNIYYEFNSAMLTPESTQELITLLTLLNDNQTAIVEIAAHTDNVGTPTANQSMSQRRAQSVVDFLTSRGISADRLRAKGYGATQPIADNKSEPSRAKNRRTEFKLVGEIKK